MQVLAFKIIIRYLSSACVNKAIKYGKKNLICVHYPVTVTAAYYVLDYSRYFCDYMDRPEKHTQTQNVHTLVQNASTCMCVKSIRKISFIQFNPKYWHLLRLILQKPEINVAGMMCVHHIIDFGIFSKKCTYIQNTKFADMIELNMAAAVISTTKINKKSCYSTNP